MFNKMRKSTFRKKRVINKMIGLLLAMDAKEKVSFTSEVILNLALYGGKDCFKGLNMVEHTVENVRKLYDSLDFKKEIRKVELKVEHVA